MKERNPDPRASFAQLGRSLTPKMKFENEGIFYYDNGTNEVDRRRSFYEMARSNVI